MKFSIRISSVNVTKFTGNWKTSFFVQCNYRPVSLLSHISKVFERVIYNQINEYIEPFLLKILTGFHKDPNTQHSLLKTLEHFKEALDKGNSVLSSWAYPKCLIP